MRDFLQHVCCSISALHLSFSAFRFITFFAHLLYCIVVLVKHLSLKFTTCRPTPRGAWQPNTAASALSLSLAIVVFLHSFFFLVVYAFLHISLLSVFYCCSCASYTPPSPPPLRPFNHLHLAGSFFLPVRPPDWLAATRNSTRRKWVSCAATYR